MTFLTPVPFSATGKLVSYNSPLVTSYPTLHYLPDLTIWTVLTDV